jgi:heat shock protein HslJ
MKKRFFTVSLILVSIIYTGCGTSNGSDENFMVTSGNKSDKLGTLGTQELDLKQTLSEKNWTEIKMDIDQFFATSIATVNKTYKIDMSFENGNLTAYADCKKLTARYKADDTKITFSRITDEPDLDHATCQQSEDADQAVYQFLNNSFEATKIKKSEITFKSDDFDAEVVLKR